jgi:hypothetical protein
LYPGIEYCEYEDKSKYEGEIYMDVRKGSGMYHYANGDIYIGEW